MSKETYYSVKRDLLQCQKRPTTVSKETYYSVNAWPKDMTTMFSVIQPQKCLNNQCPSICGLVQLTTTKPHILGH